MPFVLDASVAISWAIRDEDHPTADAAFLAIQTESAVAPGIFWYEIRNVLLLAERRNRISLQDCLQFLRALDEFDVEMRFPEGSERVIDLARKSNLSIYDAAYLSLALEENFRLATLDSALQRAAVSMGVPLLT
jgi:predicted nucleic acid-binding protein